MSKKVSELEELLKFLGVDSIEDIKLQMQVLYYYDPQSQYYSSTVIPTPTLVRLEYKRPGKSYYSSKEFCYLNKCRPCSISYYPDNLTYENYTDYSETFKFSNCKFNEEDIITCGQLVLSKNLLKQLDNKVIIELYLLGD